jgi:hypothetical protein
MKITNTVCCFFMLSYVFAVPLSAQFPGTYIHVNGYIYDMNGSPVKGAYVTLKKCGRTALSNDSGFYKIDTLDCIVTAVHGRQSTSLSPGKPFTGAKGIYLWSEQSRERARVTLYTLSGKRAYDMQTVLADPGRYRINPFAERKINASQIYLVRVQVGDRISFLKASFAYIRPLPAPVVEKTGKEGLRTGNVKIQAVSDSIIVTANGFVREARGLVEYEGTHYFYLHAPNAAEKLMNVSFSLRTGVTENDPVPSQCTALWLEDMNNNYLTTLFVSKWLSESGYMYNKKNSWCVICPDWRDSGSWEAARQKDRQFVDAVTRPTPYLGSNVISFNPQLWSLAHDTMQICLEAHVEGAYNCLCKATINFGADSAAVAPRMIYVPAKHPYLSVEALENVAVTYSRCPH